LRPNPGKEAHEDSGNFSIDFYSSYAEIAYCERIKNQELRETIKTLKRRAERGEKKKVKESHDSNLN
jgi:hypothetical protein